MRFKEVRQGMMVYLSAYPDETTTKGRVVCPLALGSVEGQLTTAVEVRSTVGTTSICYIHPKHLSPVSAGIRKQPNQHPGPIRVPYSED